MGRKELVLLCLIQKWRQQELLNGEETLQNLEKCITEGLNAHPIVVQSELDFLKAPW